MKTILISGANGFVGSNFTAYLSQFKYDIIGLSRKPGQGVAGLSNNFTWNELFRLKEFSINTMIHFAGKAHELDKTGNEKEYFTVNADLTKMLFDVFLQGRSETFIYFSSVKAVADCTEGVLTEDAIPNPQTVYGKSKLKAEEYLLAQKLPQSKRLLILRPCMIHGPGNRGNLNLLYLFVRKGIPYPLGAFKNKRSFLSIDNMSFALRRLIEDATIPSGIYHLADDEALSPIEVIKIISESLNRRLKLLAIPQSIVRIIAAIGNVIKLPLNSDRLKKLTENYVVSNDKIKKALHIDYFPVSSREGLKKTIASFDSVNS